MRDKRFVAEHRGGPLKKEQHIQLIIWACLCVEHVLPILNKELDPRLKNALITAEEWSKGNVSVGNARNASVESHAVARESSDPVITAIARAIGHTVATAHMADHSLGGAVYSLKALKISGKSVDEEREWQNKQLPDSIKELVLTTRTEKERLL